MPVVRLLPLFAARGMQGGAFCDDDVVAAIGGRIEDGLMLSHQQDCYSRSQAPQGRGGDAGLCGESLVRSGC